MNFKITLLVIVSGVCGVAAGYCLRHSSGDRFGDQASKEAEKIVVLVAKRQIEMGETLKIPHDLFDERAFIKGEEPRDAISRFDDLKARMVKRSLRQGNFVRNDDLLPCVEIVQNPEMQNNGISSFPRDGVRAIGIHVRPESIADNFSALPHSRVDIVQTIGTADSSRTRSILENTLVLAVERKSTRESNGDAMSPVDIVTLAVFPEDAMTLALARDAGPFGIVERKLSSNKTK